MSDEPEVDYGRLREGLCPVHGTALERRVDQGWCETCKMGWSMTPETVTLHCEFTGAVFDGKPLGPGNARFTRRVKEDW